MLRTVPQAMAFFSIYEYALTALRYASELEENGALMAFRAAVRIFSRPQTWA